MSGRKIRGKVTSWGQRLQVPAAVLHMLGLGVGDEVEWEIDERDGEKVAILRKKEEVMN